jgi:hypothetical protein
VLHRNPKLELLNTSNFLPDGVPARVVSADGTLQLWTHEDNADSMFLALFSAKDL